MREEVNEMAKFPKCLQGRYDCFAIRNGDKCDCLNNTNFGKRLCPFYKKAQIETAVGIDGMMEKPIEIRKEGRYERT